MGGLPSLRKFTRYFPLAVLGRLQTGTFLGGPPETAIYACCELVEHLSVILRSSEVTRFLELQEEGACE